MLDERDYPLIIMTDIKERFCKLCLTNAIIDKNFTIIENCTRDMLDVLLLKLNLDDTINVLCGACSAKLFAAFEFKSVCLYTNNTIKIYADCEQLPLDIRDIFVKEIENKEFVNTIEDQEVCRLCMQLIADDFLSLQETDHEVLQTFIPEINFNLTKDPVVCKMCFDSLYIHAGFLHSCSYEQTENENSTDTRVLKNSPPCQLIHTDGPKVQVHKCKQCNYQIKHKQNLSSHELIHKDASEVQMYKCNECDYETRHKRYLKYHQLRHRSELEVQIYKCKDCDYQVKHKHNLTRHELTHKDASELEMYKCKECDYQTKLKIHLKRHQLRHKDVSEVQMYKCKECAYQTKQKYCLVRHEQKHKDVPEVQMYKCGECEFQTTQKRYLKQHQQRHKPEFQEQMYKCDECDYQAKHKNSVTRHKVKHRDPFEVQMYKCKECSYQTREKRSLARHGLRHKDRPGSSKEQVRSGRLLKEEQTVPQTS